MKENYKEIYTNILQIYFNGYVNILPKNLQSEIFRVGIINRVLFYYNYVYTYSKEVIKSSTVFNPSILDKKNLSNRILFYANTKNQYDALRPIFKNFTNAVWVSRGFNLNGEKRIVIIGFSRLLYLIKFRKYVTLLLSTNYKERKSFLNKIFEASGQFEYIQKVLKKYSPSAVIISNDHSITSRSLLLAAKSLEIPTIYMQHASVSEYFPNLEACLNLLEGQHALDMYKKCGPIKGEVKLVGMPKFDFYLQKRNFKKEIDNVGICLNPADKIETIIFVIYRLAKMFPKLNFVFRKHPRDNRRINLELLPNIKESNSQVDDSFVFLSKVDVIIAGDTSIHLEATLLNIISIYFSFSESDKLKDYYGYIKSGMIQEAKSVEEMETFLNNLVVYRPSVYHKASYYNALIGRSGEGKSIELVTRFIENHLSKVKNN